MADIRSSTKETFATFNLAQLLYEEGDFERASVYIEKAIEDATFYGARQRKMQVSAMLPIIQGAKISYIERQRKLWLTYALIATLVLIILGLLIVVIYKQFNKLKRAEKIISDARNNLEQANLQLHRVNETLKSLNTELQDVNGKLREANKIKEEYIGYFFNISSVFFEKIVRFKNLIDQKIADRKPDELRMVLNNINMRNEREDLLKSFDKVFLKLFPTFVEEFNKLFNEEDQIILKNDELLNNELRIYALMRMGITENEKIAQILEYSVKTIYAYKTKIRNRTIVPKDEFDKRVMAVKSI
jgi:tetratricopeptide (TPR) repeat protein